MRRMRVIAVIMVAVAVAGCSTGSRSAESTPSTSSAATEAESTRSTSSPAATEAVAPTRPPRDQESPADRLARWKTSLLDLSLRNRLLNFKDSKKSIPLLCPDIAGLEDGLAANEAFRVRSKPKTWDTSDPRDAALHKEQAGGGDALADYLREEMSQKRLHADVTDRELAARLTQIERAAVSGAIAPA